MQNKSQGKPKINWFDLLENIFITFAFITALIAIAISIIWLVTSLYSPYEDYKYFLTVSTKNGETLQVEYPQLILVNGKTATLKFALTGDVDKQQSINVVLPDGELQFPNTPKKEIVLPFDSNKLDTLHSLQVDLINSQAGWGLGLYRTKILTISSAELLSEPVSIAVSAESASWAALREFVNRSINDKTPFILLIPGLISGVGTFLLQLRKNRLEREKENQQKQDEIREKYLEEIHKRFDANPVATIHRFVERNKIIRLNTSSNNEISYEDSDFLTLLEINNWRQILARQIFTFWGESNYIESDEVINDICFLDNLLRGNLPDDATMLTQLNDLLKEQKTIITDKNADCILKSYEYWKEPIKPFLLTLLRGYFNNIENIQTILNCFGRKQSLGLSLLKDAQLQDAANRNSILSSTLTREAEDLGGKLATGVNWQSLWQSCNPNTDPGILGWLNYFGHDTRYIPFGSEYAELDYDLGFYQVEHPIYKKVKYAQSMLIYGEEGVGKTAMAYMLQRDCRINQINDGDKNNPFPIYARFQPLLEPREWLIETTSLALTQFVSQNPWRFLNANATQKTAMAILMLWQSDIDRLHNTFLRSGQVSDYSWELINKELKKVKAPKHDKKLSDAVTVELLHMARPDRFNSIYFLLDVVDDKVSIDASKSVVEFLKLALPLARQDFFLKIFTVASLVTKVGKIPVVNHEITWDDELLKNLISRRFERLNAFCDRRVKNPQDVILKFAQKSPRKAIQYGNELIRYVEAHFKENDRLNAAVFSEVYSIVDERNSYNSSGGE